MDKKIAVIAIVISENDSVEQVNKIFHDFRDYVIGRLGIPYRERNVNVISIVVDAPQEIINSISGKLGMIKGVSSKVVTTK